MQHDTVSFRQTGLALLLTGILATGVLAAPRTARADDGLEPATIEDPQAADDATQTETQGDADEQQPEAPAAPIEEAPAQEPAQDAPVQGDSSTEPAVPAADQEAVTQDSEADPAQDEPAPADLAQTPAADDADAQATPPATPATPAADASESSLAPAAGQDPAVPAAPGVERPEGLTVIQTTLADSQVVEAAGSKPRNGAAARTKTYNKKLKNQKWVVTRYKDTLWYYLYSAANEGLALGVNGKAKVGAAVALVDASKTKLVNVLWSFVKGGSGTYKLASAANRKLFLTVADASSKDNTGLVLAKSKGGEAGRQSQRFYYDSVKPQVENRVEGMEGAYVLTDKASGLVANISKASKKNGGNLNIAKKNGKTCQKIYLEPVGDGWYKAWVVGSGKVLAVKGSSILDGANVIQWSNGKTANRLWALVANRDGTYSLYNKASGHMLSASGTTKGSNLYSGAAGASLELDSTTMLTSGIVEVSHRKTDDVVVGVSDASAANGAKLNLWTDGDGLHQRFQLVSAGKGLWRVRTAASGGYLSVRSGKLVQFGKGATPADATNVWRETFRGGWFGLVLNDGSDRALALAGSPAKGTKLTVAAIDGSAAQHFTFTRANLIEGGVYYLSCSQEVAKGKSGTLAVTNKAAHLEARTGDDNERFLIQKVGSAKNSVVKLINAKSGRALTAAAGSDATRRSVGEAAFSGASGQLWQMRIVDGGLVALVDDSGKGFTLSAGGEADAYGAYAAKAPSDPRAFKLEAGSGWVRTSGTWHYYNTSGEAVTMDGFAHTLVDQMQEWSKSKKSFFKKQYVITTSITKTRTIVWEKRLGKWVPKFDWLCATSSPTIGSNRTGWFRIGAGDGGCVSRYTTNGRAAYIPTWGAKYAMFLVMDLAIHSGSQIGTRASHGCVRLPVPQVKWIWDHCPNGTGVHLFM